MPILGSQIRMDNNRRMFSPVLLGWFQVSGSLIPFLGLAVIMSLFVFDLNEKRLRSWRKDVGEIVIIKKVSKLRWRDNRCSFKLCRRT